MMIKVHPWNSSGGTTDKLQTINVGVIVEIDVPTGKHVAKAMESIIYNEHDGTYAMHDYDFVVVSAVGTLMNKYDLPEDYVKHEQYPLAGECKKLHGSVKGGMQTTAWVLIVADEPFSVKHCYMAQDERWGTFHAKIDHYYTDSAPIELSHIS